MRLRSVCLLLAMFSLRPAALAAQAPRDASGWSFAGGLGVGYANVPTSPTPVYFDATQLTVRLAAQHALGAGLHGGVALLATLHAEGSDCVGIGPCAPQVQQDALYASLSYIQGNTMQQWMPMVSVGAGVARLRTNSSRIPVHNTLVWNAAFDLPLMVRPRTALLLGWDYSLLPNAPGDRININALVLTLRRTPARSGSR